MKINDETLKLIKEFEGLYLTAYYDCVGVITIGYGITNADKSITGTTIRKGLKISKATAEKWLIQSLEKKYAPKVLKYQDKYGFNENEFGALVSFAFNIGSIDGLTANGTRSRATIRKKMLEYCKGGGKVLKGLQRRRRAELALFNKPVKAAAPKEEVKPTSYTGALPTFSEKRSYYKVGDGYKTLKSYKAQIKLLQKAINWALKNVKGYTKIEADGKYGKDTEQAVIFFQTHFKFVSINGKWGKQCNKKMKEIKR